MRKVWMFLLLPVVLFFFTTPLLAADVENIPIVGILAGVLEIPGSTVKNIAECDSFWACVNVPKHLGKGVINGTERIIGTTVLPGSYKRKFGENSKIAQNKLLSNAVGWGAVGYLATATGLIQFGTDAIFSIDQMNNAGLVAGALTGAGVGTVDAVANSDLYDKDKE